MGRARTFVMVDPAVFVNAVEALTDQALAIAGPFLRSPSRPDVENGPEVAEIAAALEGLASVAGRAAGEIRGDIRK